jgi:hypothetical protein
MVGELAFLAFLVFLVFLVFLIFLVFLVFRDFRDCYPAPGRKKKEGIPRKKSSEGVKGIGLPSTGCSKRSGL